jgi:predicted transposase YbfD/YdcC
VGAKTLSIKVHWGIENELHWVLDVAFREDDSRVRAGNAAANFSAIRQLALDLLKQRTEQKVESRRDVLPLAGTTTSSIKSSDSNCEI